MISNDRNSCIDRLFFLVVALVLPLGVLAYEEPGDPAALPASINATGYSLIDSYEFDQLTLDGCGWIEYPGGFLGDPPGSVAPKNIIDSFIPSSADNKGLEITVRSQQVAFIFAREPIQTNGKPVLICITIRSVGGEASLALGALKGNLSTMNNVDGSVATLMPATAQNYTSAEKRMVMQYKPDAGGEVTPLFQVASTSKTFGVSVWVDKLEVYQLEDAIFSSKSFSTPKPLESITIPLPNLPTNAVPLEMVLIPAGTFTMGSPINELNRDTDEPQHQVTISKPFYIGKYEVTQAQWQTLIGANPSHRIGPNYSVGTVKWTDCLTFISELNKLGLGTFRLPTEAEWEYACRAGTTTAFYWGEDLLGTEITKYAWYLPNSGDEVQGVGLTLPNPWGLYDMAGNMYEWCQDIYGNLSSDAQTDPLGSLTGSNRVVRSGSYHSISDKCRSAWRDYDAPGVIYWNYGFRVVLIPVGQ